jgi:hypothetical protein
MRTAFLLSVAAFAASAAHARPVTYPGGSMSMTEVNGDTVTTQVDHTLNRHMALGVYGLSENDGDACRRVSSSITSRCAAIPKTARPMLI